MQRYHFASGIETICGSLEAQKETKACLIDAVMHVYTILAIRSYQYLSRGQLSSNYMCLLLPRLNQNSFNRLKVNQLKVNRLKFLMPVNRLTALHKQVTVNRG